MKSRTTIFKAAFSLILLLFFSFGIYAQNQPKPGNNNGWVIKNPFQNDVFIQNNGQFTKYEKDAIGDNILYYTKKGRLHLYFTANALTIGMDSLSIIGKSKDADKKHSAEEEEPLANLKSNPYFLKMNWVGANPNPRLEVKEPVSNYFTYPNPDNPKLTGILAHAWKRLIYHDLYPGIDVEFFFPEKGGLEYTITVHPGADPSIIKMFYSGDVAIVKQNTDVRIKWVTAITDHAPTAKSENGSDVSAAFRINNNSVSFVIGSYDKSKNLVIDPWFTTTSLGGTNQAYDIGYDMEDNVYVYGGGASVSYELQKYNSGGTLVWTYTSTFSYQYAGAYFYGDLAVDARTGTSYMCEGFNGNTNAGVIKVNSNGIQAAAYVSTNVAEIWRITYDYCNNALVMALGAWTVVGNCVATLDTNCTTFNNANALNETQPWDNSLLGVDNAGKCYVASDAGPFNNQVPYGNLLYQVPLPSLTPTAYMVSDKHDFIEISSITYYPVVGGYAGANGMNGLAATPTKVFTYDGGKMREWQASNGALLDSAAVSGTYQAWGGIDLDCEKNIYCGNNNSISVYDTNMNLVNTIALSNTVYDVAVSPHGYIYACGNGYVQCVRGHKVAAVTAVQPGCSCAGSITAHPCGKGPFTYLWSNGATTSSITGLCAGSYTVTVTSHENCAPNEDTAIAKLIATGIGFTVTCTPIPVSCSSGNITTAIAGGTSPYTFLWSNGATTSNLTAVIPGPYTVVVTDANGCRDTASVTLVGLGGPTVTSVTVNDQCFGDSTGTINLTVTGGTSPYTYNWAPVAGTNSNLTGLSAGTYSCTVSDAGGCIQIVVDTVKNPPQMRDSAAAITQPLCNNGTGTITIGVKGGTGSYTYSWNPGGGSNATESNLTAATYTVTITDANGCSNTTSATIVPPLPISTTVTTVPSACSGNSGSATVNASGGTGAYTYSWNPGGATNATASNLSSGSYTVTVTDAHGCTATASALVGNTGGLTDTIVDLVQVKCYQAATGVATDSVTGGTPGYTYSWSGGQTTSSATGLSAGRYTVTTTDSRGCVIVTNFTITQPPQLRDSITAQANITCFGLTNGSATVGVKGGTGAYTYAWTPGGQSTVTANNLAAGNYTITITDANGCTASAMASITQPPALKLTAAGFPDICNGGNSGQATVIPSGGTLSYTYMWSNGNTTANANGLGAGSYTITVTDAHGCIADTTVTVSQPAPIADTFSVIPASGCSPLCVNFTDNSTDPGGTITRWNWQFGDGGTDTIKRPAHCYANPGQYNVTLNVTDNKGCTQTRTITNMITVYSHPVAAFTESPQPTTIIAPVIYFTDKSTDAYGVVTNWLWTFGDLTDSISSLQNPVHTYQDTGTYCATLRVTNLHGCTDSVTECLVIEPLYNLYIPSAFTPNGDGLNDVFLPKGEYVKSYDLWVFDRWGMMIFHSNNILLGWNGMVNSKICQEDTYVYLIKLTDVLNKNHQYIGRVTLIK